MNLSGLTHQPALNTHTTANSLAFKGAIIFNPEDRTAKPGCNSDHDYLVLTGGQKVDVYAGLGRYDINFYDYLSALTESKNAREVVLQNIYEEVVESKKDGSLVGVLFKPGQGRLEKTLINILKNHGMPIGRYHEDMTKDEFLAHPTIAKELQGHQAETQTVITIQPKQGKIGSRVSASV